MKTKEEFIEKVNGVQVSLTLAVSYFKAYESLSWASENRLDELNLAPGFFGLTAKALLHGFFMETAKLFESPKRGYSIEKFLNVCEQQLFKIPQNKAKEAEIFETTNEDGATITIGVSVAQALGIEIDISQIVKDWKCELGSLSVKIENLMGIRDKYYGHIDKGYMNNLNAVFKEFPFSSLYELKELLDFANQVLNGARGYLIGVDLDPNLSNSADLKNLLNALHATKHDIYGNKIDEEVIRKLRYPDMTTEDKCLLKN